MEKHVIFVFDVFLSIYLITWSCGSTLKMTEVQMPTLRAFPGVKEVGRN